MKKHKKLLLIILSIIIIPILLILLIMNNPLVLLPHEHISITLPFKPEVDSKTNMIPMGEKIEHNEENGNSYGHAGIDFQWEELVEIIASHDGIITEIQNTNEGVNVTITSGYYKTVYKELEHTAEGIKLFSKVKQGDLIGYPNITVFHDEKTGINYKHGQLHWEFSSSSMLLDRLCPVNYFDADAKTRIDQIWKNVPEIDQFKSAYPEICNGYFADRED